MSVCSSSYSSLLYLVSSGFLSLSSYNDLARLTRRLFGVFFYYEYGFGLLTVCSQIGICFAAVIGANFLSQ